MGDEALIASLRAAVAASPDDVPLRLHLGKVLLEGGRPHEAIVEAAAVVQRRRRLAGSGLLLGVSSSSPRWWCSSRPRTWTSCSTAAQHHGLVGVAAAQEGGRGEPDGPGVLGTRRRRGAVLGVLAVTAVGAYVVAHAASARHVERELARVRSAGAGMQVDQQVLLDGTFRAGALQPLADQLGVDAADIALRPGRPWCVQVRVHRFDSSGTAHFVVPPDGLMAGTTSC